MNPQATLAAFDEQVRRSPRPEEPGARAERIGDIARHVAPNRDGWSGVVWSSLDEGSADAAIAEQARYFTALGQKVEWKLYDYDLPGDLPGRLLARGFVPEPEEALMVAEIAELALDVAPPPGIDLIPVTDEAGVDRVVRVHEEVFGVDHAWLGRALRAQVAETPPPVAAVVAMDGEAPVCSARVALPRDGEFASLWGGGTLPAYRGRGIYRAVVAHRAKIARERGFRYVYLDARPESRAILERVGFVKLAIITPFVLDPARGYHRPAPAGRAAG